MSKRHKKHIMKPFSRTPFEHELIEGGSSVIGHGEVALIHLGFVWTEQDSASHLFKHM